MGLCPPPGDVEQGKTPLFGWLDKMRGDKGMAEAT